MNDKTRFRTNVVIFVAVAFGIARLVMPIESEVHKEDVFKDFAHLFVGALFGAAIATSSAIAISSWHETMGLFVREIRQQRSVFLAVAWSLTILEVVAFFIHKA